jgi:hypothetical protein
MTGVRTVMIWHDVGEFFTALFFGHSLGGPKVKIFLDHNYALVLKKNENE